MAKVKINFVNGECEVEVKSFWEYMRGPDGACALCKGDPCLEEKNSKNKKLKDFWKNNPDADTCPVCLGRPT